MWIVDLAVALVIGALSGMGIGGGGLLVIYLTSFRGVDQITAQGLNLYFFIFASVAALFIHCTRRKINYHAVLISAAFGMAFAYLGSRTAAVTDPMLVRRIFGAMLIFAGTSVLFKNAVLKRMSRRENKNNSISRTN